MVMPRLFFAAFAALCVLPGALSHTWIEQLRNINDQGQYVGEYGYARGMSDKTQPGHTGNSMNWLLPQPNEKTNPFIGEASVLCHPSQRKQEQVSSQYPRLQSTPGTFIAMRYVENGHVSLVNDATNKPKPEKGGTVFIYGTTQPSEDETLVNVLRWTADGQGGDKRGVLLATNNYDDGRCYELNPSDLSNQRKAAEPNFALGQVSDGPGNFQMYCESNAALPKDAPVGKPYTLYWVWQWNTQPGKNPGEPNGKDEYYTTCMDVDVVDTLKQDLGETLKFAMGQQDAMSIAVSNWASRTAIYTDPIKMEVGPVFSNSPSTGNDSEGTARPSKTTFATRPSAKPSAPADGIPILSERPGRPQPTQGSGSRPGNGGPVTVTNTVVITVTASAVPVQATQRAKLLARNGAKFQHRFIDV